MSGELILSDSGAVAAGVSPITGALSSDVTVGSAAGKASAAFVASGATAPVTGALPVGKSVANESAPAPTPATSVPIITPLKNPRATELTSDLSASWGLCPLTLSSNPEHVYRDLGASLQPFPNREWQDAATDR